MTTALAELERVFIDMRNSIRHANYCSGHLGAPCRCDADRLWEESRAALAAYHKASSEDKRLSPKEALAYEVCREVVKANLRMEKALNWALSVVGTEYEALRAQVAAEKDVFNG